MKKKLTFFILLLLLIISASCEGNSGKRNSTYLVNREDHSQGYAYPAGYYYEYAVATHDEQVHPLVMFKALRADGITVIEGWHRSYLTGCRPPGSDRSTTAIYSNALIVRLDEPNEGILRHQFRALKLPRPIPCGYEVRHYMLNR